MLEQAAAFADGRITAATIDLAFGVTGRNYARTLVDAMIARDAALLLRTIDEASDAGTDMQVLIRTLISEFRNLLVGRIEPELLSRDLAPEDAQAAVARSGETTQTQVIRALRLLTEALATARASGHPRLELESALLRFVLAAEDPTIDALSARIAALESGAPVSVAAPPAPATAPAKVAAAPKPEPVVPKAEPAIAKPTNGGPLSLQKIRASWNNVRARIEGERMPLRGPLSRAQLDSLDGNVLTIKLPNDVEADILRGEQKLVEHAIADVVGEPVRVTFRVDGGGSGRTARGPAPAQPADDPADLLQYASERIR